ncbi:MAG: hypothetical protein ACXIU7_08830 [Roseinatronobacter sp.]
MDTRTNWSKLTFRQPFVLPGSEVVFAPGEYDLVTEDERLQGLTFTAYRRISAFLEVPVGACFPERMELRPVTDADLQQALAQARRPDDNRLHNDHRLPDP